MPTKKPVDTKPADPTDADPLTILSSPKRAVPAMAHGTGPWGVSAGPEGRVVLNDDGGGSFTAPMGATPEDEAARFRQYANLQVRQQFAGAVKAYEDLCRAEGIEADIMDAMFMGAVNGFAAQRGVDVSKLPIHTDAKYGAEFLAKEHVRGVGSLATSTIATAIAQKARVLWGAISGIGALAWGYGRNAAGGAPLDSVKLAELAKQMQAAFERKRLSESMSEMPREGAASDLSPEEREKLNNRIASMMSSMKGMTGARRKELMRSLWGQADAAPLSEQIEKLREDAARGGSDVPPWGQMKREVLRMTRRAIRHSFRHRPTFIGAFRYPHRALIPAMDGRAWHAKLSGLGGTVLLDLSGSMSIDESQLLEMLKQSPLATIAGYNGGLWSSSDGLIAGNLTVFTKEGRYAAETVWPQRASYNVVDGPALRWLAKQARPRVWISDGGVTGAGRDGEVDSETLALECALLCRMAGVTQYLDIPAYLKSHHHLWQFK